MGSHCQRLKDFSSRILQVRFTYKQKPLAGWHCEHLFTRDGALVRDLCISANDRRVATGITCRDASTAHVSIVTEQPQRSCAAAIYAAPSATMPNHDRKRHTRHETVKINPRSLHRLSTFFMKTRNHAHGKRTAHLRLRATVQPAMAGSRACRPRQRSTMQHGMQAHDKTPPQAGATTQTMTRCLPRR